MPLIFVQIMFRINLINVRFRVIYVHTKTNGGYGNDKI